MKEADFYVRRLKKFKWVILALAALSITAIEAYYHFIRGVPFTDNVIDWLIGMTVAVVLIEITFRTAQRLQNRLAQEMTQRIRGEEALRDRMKFEKLIMDISTEFVNLKWNEVDDGIHRAMQALGLFAGVDRSYVFLFRDGGKFMDNTHEWCAPGIEPQIQKLQGLPTERFSWATQRLLRGEVLHIPRVADLPAEAGAEKEEFESQDILSMVNVPIVCKGNVMGFIGFDSVRAAKAWDDDTIALLRIVGEILANALERKRAEQELREVNQTLQALVDASPLAIIALDREARVRMWNPAAERIFGWRKEEVIGRFNPIVPRERREEFLGLFWRVLAGERYANYEVHRQGKDGSWIELSLSTARLSDAEGNVIGVMGILADITEQKRAARALQESEEGYQDLYDNAPVGYHEIDGDGRIVRVNRTEADLLGYSREEMLGRHVFEFVAQPEIEQVKESVRRRIAQEEQVGRVERTFVRKDGCEIQVAVEDKLVRNSENQVVGIRSVVQDITERKRLEEQLRQAQKMEAIGQLAGGVAHDFNNLLTGVIGNLTLAEMEAPEEIREFLRGARDASNRMANLVTQLLAFSRKSRISLQPVDLNRVVEQAYRLARETIDRRIEMVLRTQENLPPVHADSAQVTSVLMNLCVNARDAIQEVMEGRAAPDRRDDPFVIQIQTRTVDTGARDRMRSGFDRGGSLVVVSVSDNGAGMDEETQSRVFEPFFTTKGVGKGTGLGLSGAYGIIKQHGGWIDIQSQPGKGTTIEIYFPAARQQPRESEGEPVEQIAGGSETILLVDDEEMIRDVGLSILESHGYTVLLAGDGREALDLYMKEGDRIDLVVLDLSMPRLSGREFLERVRELDAGAKIIVSSGYSEDSYSEILDQLGVAGYIPKPYRPSDLALKVRQVLDGVR